MNIPKVMGIINVTPDSFSGDGLLDHPNVIAKAVAQAKRMVAEGATILDIGGESSRPGATPVTEREEIRRVAPVIAAIHEQLPDVVISIDTIKAEVAKQALHAGASIINDISALAGDKNMAALVATAGARVVLMHNGGSESFQGGTKGAPQTDDIVAMVIGDLQKRIDVARASGIAKDKIILDPGIGFGKTPQHNLALIAQLDRLKTLGFPVLMAPSRKGFISHVLGTDEGRLEGTAACIAVSIMQGADIVRVHDVAFMARVVKMTAALRIERN